MFTDCLRFYKDLELSETLLAKSRKYDILGVMCPKGVLPP